MCIFCNIVGGKTPAVIEGENEGAIAFKSIKPVADIHILVIPKKHIESFMDIDLDKKDDIFYMVQLAQKIINEKEISEGYKININGGCYQSVPHIHFHILGGELEDKDDILGKT